MTHDTALRHWVDRLRHALGGPVKTPIITDDGLRMGYRLPDPEEQARALDLSLPELVGRLAQDGLTVRDVAMEYVGGTTRPFKLYVGPG
jgi:hypothetical protein